MLLCVIYEYELSVKWLIHVSVSIYFSITYANAYQIYIQYCKLSNVSSVQQHVFVFLTSYKSFRFTLKFRHFQNLMKFRTQTYKSSEKFNARQMNVQSFKAYKKKHKHPNSNWVRRKAKEYLEYLKFIWLESPSLTWAHLKSFSTGFISTNSTSASKQPDTKRNEMSLPYFQCPIPVLYILIHVSFTIENLKSIF